MITSKYFSEKEFNNCIPSCSLQDMNQQSIDRFDKAREIANIPFVINSAYRTKEYEKLHGRNGTSAHTEGMSIDIRCNTSANRFKVITALLKAGFTRIGIGKTYIHADDSKIHTQQVIWDYYK